MATFRAVNDFDDGTLLIGLLATFYYGDGSEDTTPASGFPQNVSLSRGQSYDLGSQDDGVVRIKGFISTDIHGDHERSSMTYPAGSLSRYEWHIGPRGRLIEQTEVPDDVTKDGTNINDPASG